MRRFPARRAARVSLAPGRQVVSSARSCAGHRRTECGTLCTFCRSIGTGAGTPGHFAKLPRPPSLCYPGEVATGTSAHTAEVVICGAGIAGIATAYHLAARRGVNGVVLVDERPPLSLTSDKSTECYRNWWPGPGDAMVALMTRSIDLLEDLAREIHARARGGEDFGQLALAYSQAQSALERGKLGWRQLGQLPQFIAELVVGMKAGDVSEPVRTPTGFHIVRLDETRGGDTGPMMVEQLHSRHILMRPNEVQDDATTRQRLAALRERILAGEDFGALASVTSEDPGSASRGGDLGWNSPGVLRRTTNAPTMLSERSSGMTKMLR